MAIAKRRATTKSPAKKRKAAAPKKAAKKYKTIGGLKYDPQGCFGTKAAAQKSAETLRSRGKKVRVIPQKKGTGACIYVR